MGKPLEIETWRLEEVHQVFEKFKKQAGRDWAHVLLELIAQAIYNDDLCIVIGVEAGDKELQEPLLLDTVASTTNCPSDIYIEHGKALFHLSEEEFDIPENAKRLRVDLRMLLNKKHIEED